jgi:hypothetical protein
MNNQEVKKYLENRGYDFPPAWNWDEFLLVIKEMKFTGEECGYLKFKKTASGKRYIQFCPGRCYLD